MGSPPYYRHPQPNHQVGSPPYYRHAQPSYQVGHKFENVNGMKGKCDILQPHITKYSTTSSDEPEYALHKWRAAKRKALQCQSVTQKREEKRLFLVLKLSWEQNPSRYKDKNNVPFLNSKLLVKRKLFI